MTLENLSLALYLNNLEIIKRINKLKEDVDISNAQELELIKEKLQKLNNDFEKHIKDNNIHISSDIKNIIDKLSDSDGKLLYNGQEIGTGGDIKKFTTIIHGNGNKKDFIITHNLNIDNLMIDIKDRNNERCFVDYIINDLNNITLKFENAPAGTEIYTITIL